MIIPQLAPVKPRVVSPDTGDALVLDELIQSLLENRPREVVALIGGRGAGKTTALQHLAAVLAELDQIELLDEPGEHHAGAGAFKEHLVVYSTESESSAHGDHARFVLAGWSNDELIEYLLASSPERCASVMRRIQVDDFAGRIGGQPHLWRMVLDELAADESLPDVRSALLRAVERLIDNDEAGRQAEFYCQARLLGSDVMGNCKHLEWIGGGAPDELIRAMGHRAGQLLLAARYIRRLLESNAEQPFPQDVLPRDLVSEVARYAQQDESLVERLEILLASKTKEHHPMAASILHAAGIAWRPKRKRHRWLPHAYFRGVNWAELNLSRYILRHADLDQAVLTRANLERTDLVACTLRRADLRGAAMLRMIAARADFSGSDLSDINASHGSFIDAKLNGAKLNRAILVDTDFSAADLTGASLAGANLTDAQLERAILEDADFTDVVFKDAKLDSLPLHQAQLAGASFQGASLVHCDLEYVRFPDADFHSANLRDALLTGSVMPRADFRSAKLINAGLGDIEWEQADLRDTDLSDSSFHMGSTRSGLVGSPYPCHGSRTGFYTDTYDEQYYKAPEEIRKANLRGADLRGANVTNVDFYLVDLREAIYDAEQEEHFRRCDAILEDRV